MHHPRRCPHGRTGHDHANHVGSSGPAHGTSSSARYSATVAVKGRTVKGLRRRWLLQDAANKDTGFAVSCAVGSCGVPASESGRLGHGDGGHAWVPAAGGALMLPILKRGWRWARSVPLAFQPLGSGVAAPEAKGGLDGAPGAKQYRSKSERVEEGTRGDHSRPGACRNPPGFPGPAARVCAAQIAEVTGTTSAASCPDGLHLPNHPCGALRDRLDHPDSGSPRHCCPGRTIRRSDWR